MCVRLRPDAGSERKQKNELEKCVCVHGVPIWQRDWGGLLERHSPYLKKFNALSWRKALIEIHGLAPIALWFKQTSERDTQSASDRFQLKWHLQGMERKVERGGRREFRRFFFPSWLTFLLPPQFSITEIPRSEFGFIHPESHFYWCQLLDIY